MKTLDIQFQLETNSKLIRTRTQLTHSHKLVPRIISPSIECPMDRTMWAGLRLTMEPISCGCTLCSSTCDRRIDCSAAERRGTLRLWFRTWMRMNCTRFKFKRCPRWITGQEVIYWSSMCHRTGGWRQLVSEWQLWCCSLSSVSSSTAPWSGDGRRR